MEHTIIGITSLAIHIYHEDIPYRCNEWSDDHNNNNKYDNTHDDDTTNKMNNEYNIKTNDNNWSDIPCSYIELPSI